VAKQRKAIVDGLRSSIVDFSGNVEGSTTQDIITLLLVTQYFDTIREVASVQRPSCSTFLDKRNHSSRWSYPSFDLVYKCAPHSSIQN
jgi:hypothetical protein